MNKNKCLDKGVFRKQHATLCNYRHITSHRQETEFSASVRPQSLWKTNY